METHVMRRLGTTVAIVLAATALVSAHVTVQPRESNSAGEERYTVRVPTEGTVATIQVTLEIPAGVTVLEVVPQDGMTFKTTKLGERVTAITWMKEIPPKADAEFVFRARNPASDQIIWKSHQSFADGTTTDWIGPAGDKRPASITKLSAPKS
jgi:uncharacterized protein YcnI